MDSTNSSNLTRNSIGNMNNTHAEDKDVKFLKGGLLELQL